MALSHHKFGCLNCGKRRKRKDVLDMKYDIYLVSDDGSRVRVGLCKGCFNAGNHDHVRLGKNIYQSEVSYALERDLPLAKAEKLRKNSYSGVETRSEHIELLKTKGLFQRWGGVM